MRIYGTWAGNPQGRREDESKCVVEVYSGGSYIASQCARKRGHGPDGLYCKQHAKQVEDGRHVSVPKDAHADD